MYVHHGPAKMQGVGRGCGDWDCHGNPRRGEWRFFLAGAAQGWGVEGLEGGGGGGSAALGQGDE